jgi:branched-chain amino acid transport system ATP-binding protein
LVEALRVEALSKNFGALVVLRNISLSITAFERRVVIIGPNGAGKTTLFNLISGELPPTRGTIHLFGRDVTKMPCHDRARQGLSRTFQITDLFPYFTLMENVLLAFEAHDRCRYQMLKPLRSYRRLYERAEQLLKEMRLWEKRDLPITNLAHGEMRLVELMLGMAGRPRLLLLDEPTAGLTRSEGVWLASLIQKLMKDVSLLIIEHDMQVAFNLAERIIVLHQGGIVAEGKPEDIRANPKIKEIYLGTSYA